MSDQPAVDLSNCDREPIHIPGSIQPHGCLLACDANAAIVLRHSANAPAMLRLPGRINGRPLGELLGEAAAHALRNALATASDAARPALLFGLRLASGGAFDVAVHRVKAAAIVELEPASEGTGLPLEQARTLIGRVAAIDDIGRLVQQTTRLVQALLGYDRVMVYRFEQDGAGKVIGEAKRTALESFRGQYFPASDIPQQARALYLRNTIRIISDASCVRVLLVPVLDGAGQPLDLSFAHLRSVSPIHCEYLRNMGVAASMSISIIVDGGLWGLIACHHYAPRILPMAQRVAAEMFGQFFSIHLHALMQKRRLETATRARQSLDRLLRLASESGDVGGVLRQHLRLFMELIPCNGAGLWMNGAWRAQGAAVPDDAVPGLVRLAAGMAEGRVWATHRLSLSLPEAESYAAEVSGVLAIPLSNLPRDYLFLFRKEVVQTLEWAGNPEKSYDVGPLGDRLTPRKSFAIWKETVRRQAVPWTEDDREIAEAARIALVEIVLRQHELVAAERSRADLRQRMLNEELTHRVKNILAVIKSLVGHPVEEGRTLAEYVASLKGRIQALALAHDQVVRGDGGGLLQALLEAELSPYRSGAGIELSGPAVRLDAAAFSVMALVLHELSTNAAKYGALGTADGRLEVSWRLDADGNCQLLWQESGGPPATPPTRKGFGSVLIERGIPFDLGGETSVEYGKDGLRCRFLLPAAHVSIAAPQDFRIAAPRPPASPAAAGSLDPGVSVLLVEDQMLIAMDLEAMLADRGLTRLVTTGSAAEALARLESFTPDAAVLDVNLGSGTSMAVAEALTRRHIPFVFATGYGDRAMIPSPFLSIPVVRKPYEGDDVAAAIAAVLDDRERSRGK